VSGGWHSLNAVQRFLPCLFLGCPTFSVLVLKRWVFLFSLLSLTRHFLKSASPRKRTDDSARFRFRAREQTAASRAIFAMLFALPVEAAHQLARWPAAWWPALQRSVPGSNTRLGNCSASRSSCQRREPAHAAQRPRRRCLGRLHSRRLPAPVVSRILPARFGWAAAVCWDLPLGDRRPRC
jgi:hypothetical protein